MEPILSPHNDRFVLLPIKYRDIWEMYKKAEASFWTTEEIDLSTDLLDWKNSMKTKSTSLNMYWLFLLASDGIVNEIWLFDFVRKFRSQRLGAFMVFKWLWKTFILKPTACSLTLI